MILVDYKKGGGKDKDRNIPQEFVRHIKSLRVDAEIADLEFGDFAFEGNGPLGTITVGIERKTLHDMLACIDDARYTGHQRIGMKNTYTISGLILEGHWKPHDPQGLLMEGFNGGMSWGYCQFGRQRTMYAKLYRYLLSVALSGVIVTYSRDIFHTAFNVVEWYHYFAKPWTGHTSLQEMQKIAIPTLGAKPTLVRRWAAALDGIGTKMSADAANVFKTPLALANADETEWLRVPGVGVKTAQQIVREVWGQK